MATQEKVKTRVEKKSEEKENKNKKTSILKIVRVLLVLGLLGIAALAILLYGPWGGFRDWYITSAMTTMNHQWLATMFYDEDSIKDVMEKNKIIEIDDVTDKTLISANNDNKDENVVYKNEYEKAILEKDPEHPDYKIIDIEGKAYNGYLAVVYDASKIHTMVTSRLNVCGEYVTKMAQREGAVLAINGGGFDDPNSLK